MTLRVAIRPSFAPPHSRSQWSSRAGQHAGGNSSSSMTAIRAPKIQETMTRTVWRAPSLCWTSRRLLIRASSERHWLDGMAITIRESGRRDSGNRSADTDADCNARSFTTRTPRLRRLPRRHRGLDRWRPSSRISAERAMGRVDAALIGAVALGVGGYGHAPAARQSITCAARGLWWPIGGLTAMCTSRWVCPAAICSAQC